MSTYRKSSHTAYLLPYHFAFITKYRKPVLGEDVAVRLRELVRKICRTHDIEIMRGHVCPDYMHLLLSVPPHWVPSHVMQAIKGESSHHLLRNFRGLKKEFWGQHLWARGYFVASNGNVTDEVLARYIEHQDVEPRDGASGNNE